MRNRKRFGLRLVRTRRRPGWGSGFGSRFRWLSKPVLWVAVFAVAACAGLVSYYQTVQSGYWKDRRAALERAFAETPLEKAAAVEPVGGEREAMAVFGTDAEGRDMIVLVIGEEILAVRADEGVSRNAVEVYWRQQYGEGKLIHVLPALYGGELAWEVFSLRPTDRGERYYYDYYRFSDGERIDTWTLSLK